MTNRADGLTIEDMAPRPLPLDLEVIRKGRREAEFQATGDPHDPLWLQRQLQGWLSGHGWHPARWAEFELVAREHKTWTKLATVRAA